MSKSTMTNAGSRLGRVLKQSRRQCPVRHYNIYQRASSTSISSTTLSHTCNHNGFLGYVSLGYYATNCIGGPETNISALADKNEDSYQQVYENDNFDQDKNESSFGHELVAGGAAFAGFKAFEDHQRKEGSCAHT
jgi:hypothetical protein